MSMLRSFMSLRSSESRLLLSTVSMSAVALLCVDFQKSDVVTGTMPEAIKPLSEVCLTRDTLGANDEALHVEANRRCGRMKNIKAQFSSNEAARLWK